VKISAGNALFLLRDKMEYIYVCTVKACDTSRVKSALQYVYRVAEATICIIIATIESYRTSRLIG